MGYSSQKSLPAVAYLEQGKKMELLLNHIYIPIFPHLYKIVWRIEMKTIPSLNTIFLLHFRSATDFEGGAFRLLSGGGAAASLAEPDAGNTLSPSKVEQRRQMAEALLGTELDAQG